MEASKGKAKVMGDARTKERRCRRRDDRDGKKPEVLRRPLGNRKTGKRRISSLKSERSSAGPGTGPDRRLQEARVTKTKKKANRKPKLRKGPAGQGRDANTKAALNGLRNENRGGNKKTFSVQADSGKNQARLFVEARGLIVGRLKKKVKIDEGGRGD